MTDNILLNSENISFECHFIRIHQFIEMIDFSKFKSVLSDLIRLFTHIYYIFLGAVKQVSKQQINQF